MSTITIKGLVATTPRHLTTADGLRIASFRVACTEDGSDNTNWYTISAFKSSAESVSNNITKGDRVIVTGTLTVRDWDNGERTGTSVEIEADAIGLDIDYKIGTFARVAPDAKPEHNCNCSKCDK